MQENVPLIPFLNEMADIYNYPIMTDVTDNKTLHLPNDFVRFLVLTSYVSRNILLLMMYLVAHITRLTETLEIIQRPVRKLASSLGINLTGEANYQSMITMLHNAKSAYVQLASEDAQTEKVSLFQRCDYSIDDKMVTLQLAKQWEEVFIGVGFRKTVVHWGYIKQLSSPLAIWLFLVCASIKGGEYVLEYKIDHLMKLCGQGTKVVGDFTSRLIKATYEVNAKTDISALLYFARKGHNIAAVQLRAKGKSKEEMRNAGITADAPRRTLPKVTKADMRKAVVVNTAFRVAPGHVLSVSDKHVRSAEQYCRMTERDKQEDYI